jgi:magnesium-transporting ATPase (P-type)
MVRVFLKGAPDMCLPLCSHMIGSDGSTTEMDEIEKQRILGDDVLATFATKTYRTILMAYVDYTESEWESLKDENN